MADTKRRAAIILCSGLTLAVLPGCTPRDSDVIHGSKKSHTHGVVLSRHSTGKMFWLMVKTADRGTVKVFVRLSAYRACRKGESYPGCAS